MSDFVPKEMLTVEILPGEDFTLFIDTKTPNSNFRGAFFTTGPKETSSIDVYVVREGPPIIDVM